MFLAARSLWTKPLPARYFIPAAISLQDLKRVWGVLEGTISPGLKSKIDIANIIYRMCL